MGVPSHRNIWLLVLCSGGEGLTRDEGAGVEMGEMWKRCITTTVLKTLGKVKGVKELEHIFTKTIFYGRGS